MIFYNSNLSKEGALLFINQFRGNVKYSMFKLSDDQKKIDYYGARHSGKVFALKNSIPNTSFSIGQHTLPVVVDMSDGRQIVYNGDQILDHPTKWIQVDESECEEEDDSPMFDCSLFSGGGMIDIMSPDLDFAALVAPRKLEDSSPIKKARLL